MKILTKPIFYIALALTFLFAWILWETYQANNFGFGSKTFWDWMELLIVPAVLAGAGLWFTHVQKQTELETSAKTRQLEREIAEEERKTDREIALERQRQQTLENYLDRMKELLLDRNLGPEAEPEVKRLARTWTLNVLRELTAKRNRQVIQFLQETNLLGDEATIDLHGTDLSGVDLSGANLSDVDLRAKLSGANLSRASLNRSDLSASNLDNANLFLTGLRGANMQATDLRSANLNSADLTGANLTGAHLGGIILTNANLSSADLSRANLDRADLSGAYLSEAIISERQLNQAILSDETIMPDGSTYLEWKQKQEQSQEQLIDEPKAVEIVATNTARERLAEPVSNDNQELVSNEVEETAVNSNE